MRTFYLWTRDLHLYVGLFLAPFLFVFAISAVLFNHPGWIGKSVEEQPVTIAIHIQEEALRLEGMQQIEALRPALRASGISGELGPVSYRRKQARLVVTAMTPSQSSTVDIDLKTGAATVKRTRGGLRGALLYLHKYPGQHLAAIRGNSLHMRLWRILSDAAVYLLLFISVSGVYLWAMLKAERRVGLALLIAGFVSFGLILYGLVA